MTSKAVAMASCRRVFMLLAVVLLLGLVMTSVAQGEVLLKSIMEYNDGERFVSCHQTLLGLKRECCIRTACSLQLSCAT